MTQSDPPSGPPAETAHGVVPLGLPGDPVLFKLLGEIEVIARAADARFARLLPRGLTPAQFGVLNRLVRLGRLETVSELARAFRVSQPTMSSTVAKLSAKGLVALREDPADRRIRRVALTPEGGAMRETGVAAAAEALETLDRAAPDRDWASILGALTALRAAVDAD